MKINELGEFSLIQRIAGLVGSEKAEVLVGIGDDVAVLEQEGEELLLATIDSQVEGVHFMADWITPEQLGRRLLAINLSDIAAMGGTPHFALVSLALPADCEVQWVEALYRGLRREANRFGVAIVGGNMARSPTNRVLDLCLLGRVARSQLLLRSTAQPGDKVLVTGQLGNSAAGLGYLLADESLKRQIRQRLSVNELEQLLTAHFTPTPRIREGQLIAQSQLASAMIDITDGLSSDIGHICTSSQVGVRLWANQLPISPAVRKMAQLTQQSPLQLALSGGEEYELCFTAPNHVAEEVKTLIIQETGTQVSIIGEILPPEAGRWLVLEERHEVELEAKGWTHF